MSAQQRFKTVLLFGAPGAGKGTQGKILGAIPGVVHMSSGDMFRGMDPESRLGKIFREYSTRGELVPDEVTIDLWKEHVGKLRETGRYNPLTQLLVLDGIPQRQPGETPRRRDRRAEGRASGLRRRGRSHLAAQEARSRRTAPTTRRKTSSAGASTCTATRLGRCSTSTEGADRGWTPSAARAQVLEVLKVVAPLQAERFGNALA